MAQDDISELILRLDAGKDSRYPMEAMIDGTGLWTGGSVLLKADELDAATSAREYGRNLWMKLVSPDTGWPDMKDVYARAAGTGRERVRLRFMLSMDPASNDLHKIRWELLLPEGDFDPAGVSADHPVSRFLPLPELPAFQPGAGLRMLLAIASPSDLKDPLKPIDVDKETTSVLDTLERDILEGQVRLTVMPGQTGLSAAVQARLEKLGCEVVAGPSTADAINARLAKKQVFHLIAHGNFPGKPVLMLENDQGLKNAPDATELIAKWPSNKPRLIFLQSCLSDPQDKALPSEGFAAGFVREGVPAVIAMRDFVDMTAARMFASAFYRKLLESGEPDIAANAGRNATYKAKGADWAIPVLYSRLRNGQLLWEPEPLRQTIQRLADRWVKSPLVTKPFPVEVSVVRNIDVVLREIDQPTSEARTDAFETALRELRSDSPQTRLIVLVGGRGRAKSSLLKKLFVDLAQKATTEDCPRTVLFRLKDCKSVSSHAAAVFSAWSAALAEEGIEVDKEAVRERVEDAELNLLVDGDDDLGEEEMGDAIGRIREFVAQKNRCALISMDQSAFHKHYFEASQTTVLIVRDLRPKTLVTYLDAYQKDIPPAVREILIGPLRDLAGIPWLLSKLLDMATADPKHLQSRFKVLARIVENMLARVAVVPGSNSLARTLLMEMAWRLHTRPAQSLTLSETFSLLSKVTGTRDFSLDLFWKDLIESGLLVRSGPDGFRFAYSAAHSYFTACYLNSLAPDERSERLREVVAGLGRPERLRRWEEVLVLMGGQLTQPSELLAMLLELGFGEGEHLLLAARCLHEAATVAAQIEQNGRNHSGPEGSLVTQLTDSLIWWSLPQSGLMARSRRRAVEALGYLLGKDSGEIDPSNGRDNTSRIVHHLFRLALEKVRTDPTQQKKPQGDSMGEAELDYSAVRLGAVSVLFRHQKTALEYLKLPNADVPLKDNVTAVIKLWFDRDAKGLKQFLDDTTNTVMSGVAAFVLASLDVPEAGAYLRERFLAAPVLRDVHWSILDALTEMRAEEATALITDAIKLSQEGNEVALQLSDYIVYAIGKLGGAMTEITQAGFLEEALKSPNVMLQARALRAKAEILGVTMDVAAMDKLRDICHLILDGKDQDAQRRLDVATPRRRNAWEHRQLATYTLEGLSHIGNAKSIDVLRSFYLRPAINRPDPRDEILRKSCWEMAEKIRLRIRDQEQRDKGSRTFSVGNE